MRKDYTLGEWLDVWLEYYVEPSALAPSTKACYNRAVRLFLRRWVQFGSLTLHRWIACAGSSLWRARIRVPHSWIV